MRIADRLTKVNPSSTLSITSKAKKLRSEGHEVISLAAGEPDFDTPDFVKRAACEAVSQGFTKYTPSTGTTELKKAICDKFKKDNGLEYAPSQVVVSCGAKHSIFNIMLALVNKGDEVLIPSPFWVSYPEMVTICQGVSCFIETAPGNSFKMSASELERRITPRTKLLVLNSPSNPIGCVYSRKELEAIAEICVKHKIMVISDEIYEKIMYDNFEHVSIASLGKEIFDLTITVNGLSKSHAMTGWRIGYLGGPQDIVSAISNLQDHSTSNPNSIAQKAAYAALTGPADFERSMRAEFQKRRDYALGRLDAIKGLSYIKPEGAFYLFCNIKNFKMSSAEFARRFLDEALVALIPGDSFGRDDYVRMSFATSVEQLGTAMDRLEIWLKKV